MIPLDFELNQSVLDAMNNIRQPIMPQIPDLAKTVKVVSFEERIQPIIDKLEENNIQLQETLGVQSMELMELKKHNETLKAELEQRKKSEKEAKLEAKKASKKATIANVFAGLSFISSIVLFIVGLFINK